MSNTTITNPVFSGAVTSNGAVTVNNSIIATGSITAANATATTSSSIANVGTLDARYAISNAALQSDRWYLPTNDSNGFTFVGSGATNGIKPDGYRVQTGATINSSALYRANSSGFINFGRGSFAGGVDFSRPVWLIFKSQIGLGSLLGKFRIQLGGYDGAATTVGNMTPTNTSFHGMGFEISDDTVKLETVNTQGGVATRNLSASLGAYTPFRYDLKAYSDGLGNVKAYINNTLVSTLTIGPTNSTSNTVYQLRISIENGASTQACFFDLCNSQLSVIVE